MHEFLFYITYIEDTSPVTVTGCPPIDRSLTMLLIKKKKKKKEKNVHKEVTDSLGIVSHYTFTTNHLKL